MWVKYSKIKNDVFSCRDAILTCVINTLTSIIPSLITFSILGFIAASQGSTVNDVVESGPGLVFITYPQVVLQLPGSRAWAIVFFVMLAVGTAVLSIMPYMPYVYIVISYILYTYD